MRCTILAVCCVAGVLGSVEGDRRLSAIQRNTYDEVVIDVPVAASVDFGYVHFSFYQSHGPTPEDALYAYGSAQMYEGAGVFTYTNVVTELGTPTSIKVSPGTATVTGNIRLLWSTTLRTPRPVEGCSTSSSSSGPPEGGGSCYKFNAEEGTAEASITCRLSGAKSFTESCKETFNTLDPLAGLKSQADRSNYRFFATSDCNITITGLPFETDTSKASGAVITYQSTYKFY